MAARKLQAEMDRNFKKIQEGVENFEDIESKMNAAGTTAQKEKLEADLKTQIKKLQRLRDQLKTWQTASDVKDKGPILEHRKLIETQMERFKLIEKEMKTKAYSTVGLHTHSRLDPKEQQRVELVQWLQAKVEELQQQVEVAEAELESLQVSVKKKGRAGEAGVARQEQLELQNERRNWHITQLEIILRLVENSSLKAEDVEPVKEDVEFFVTMNSEEDFEYDDGVYAELNLEHYVEAEGDGDSTAASDNDVDDPPPRPVAPRKLVKQEEDDSREEAAGKKTALPRLERARSSTKPTETTPVKATPPATTFTSQPMSSVVRSTTSSQKPPTLPPLRYAAAAAMGTSSHQTPASANAPQTPALTAPAPRVPTPPPPAPASSVPAHATPPTSTTLQHATPASKSNTPASDPPAPVSPSENAVSSVVNSPIASPVAIKEREPSIGVGSNPGAPVRLGSFGGAQSTASVTSMSLASPVVSLVEAPSASPQQPRMPVSPHYPDAAQHPTHDAQANYTLQGFLPQHQVQPPPSLVLNGVNNTSGLAAKSGSGLAPSSAGDLPAGAVPTNNNGVGPIGPSYAANSVSPSMSTNGHDERAQPKFAATLSDLISSFKTAEAKAPERIRDGEQVKEVLEIMSPTMPEPRDAEQPRYHTTRNPMATPAYYPQQMLPLLASPEFFERLDVETLFWVFYYMPGTYQQWLAAQELKKQSWRFHVKFLTWFQRHAKPDEVTDEYEQGQYLYFDWEGSWCVRKKSDFRFEYRNLSDD